MNNPIRACGILVVVGAVLVSCGRAPEPSSAPLQATSPDAATTASTSAATTAEPLTSGVPTAATETTAKPAHTHPAATTSKAAVTTPRKVTSEPPPPPEPPNRWVLGAGDRRSLEQQTHTSFSDLTLDDFYRGLCPAHDVCIRAAFRADASLGHEDEDCWVDHNVIPDPLYEGGTVTWVVNNLCGPA